jgi:outer membrane protein assembly factor BamB
MVKRFSTSWFKPWSSTPPERRTKGDVLAAVAIVAVVAVAAALIWWTSDARATISRPAASPVPTLKVATALPTSLKQLWAAPSPQTTRPVVVAGVVVTGDGRQVDGRDPVTGAVLWSYARDGDLCGVSAVYQDAVAVYPDARGCGQVSTINAKTGRRDATRTSYSDAEVHLSTDGTTVLSYGHSRLEQWRSDMVRMMSWGALDARIKPKVPIQPLCRLVSAAASPSAVSVLESCPGQTSPRLTLLRADKDEDEPLVKYVNLPGVPNDDSARVIAVNGTTTAIYVPTPQPVVNVIDESGTLTVSTLMPKPASPLTASSHPDDDLVTWWTGDSVMVFEANGLRYKYTVSPTGGQAPVGPATIMAGKLLVPVSTGYDIFDPETGAGVGHLPVTRPPGTAAVVPAVAGNTVLEQRGDTLVALG